jgi:hypothetical protein
VCPDDRSNHRECNNIQASTTETGLLRLPFTVNNIQTFVMIDSGANGCFISERFVQQYGIATRKKKAMYELRAVNGSALPDVTRETDTIQLAHQQHLEDTSLDIVEMANHNIVLRIPWLEWHNPTITTSDVKPSRTGRLQMHFHLRQTLTWVSRVTKLSGAPTELTHCQTSLNHTESGNDCFRKRKG